MKKQMIAMVAVLLIGTARADDGNGLNEALPTLTPVANNAQSPLQEDDSRPLPEDGSLITTNDVARYRQCAIAGVATMQYKLARCLYEGWGVDKDEAEAVKWLRKSAEQGITAGQVKLGVCYLSGEGVAKDEAEAAKWFRKAAEQGDAAGQVILGECYLYGAGVAVDEAEAVKWYRKAAEQGVDIGWKRLGTCYRDGIGVAKDEAEAEKYFAAAHYTFTSGEAKVGSRTWKYKISGTSATIMGASPATGVLEIPSEITVGSNTYAVTSIGSFAFNDCCELTSVTIGNGVASVEPFAFQGCSGLKTVKIGTGLTKYDSSLFNCSTGLTSFCVAEGNPMYASMNGLLLTKDGKELVQGVNGDVIIPETVTSIQGSEFHNCPGLTSINVAEGNPAYTSKNGMLLTKDGKSLVRGVAGDVTIPDGVMSIGANAFLGCFGLTSVIMPDSVTDIGQRAFGRCCNLTKVTIPNSVKTIRWGAFEHCERLMSLTIPSNVMNIEGEAFSRCIALKDFVVASNNVNYVSNNGLLLSKDGNVLVAGVAVKGKVTIPDGVTSIGDGAFSWCTITGVEMPNDITNIGARAFSSCRCLNSVTIPDSVIRIGANAFYSCNFTSITIPDSVTSIEEDAFYACHRLKSVTIGRSVKNLETFAFSNCNSLRRVTFLGDAPNLGRGVFRGAPSDCTIYVQRGSKGWGCTIPGTWNGLKIDYCNLGD